MLAAVHRTIRRRGLLTRGHRVLVGVSGGPDSMVLLHVLQRLASELGVEVLAASVDHGLRLDASLDVELARDQADALGVPFSALRVEVPRVGSLQEEARRVRYRALLDEARRLDAARLAVGHTLDDQAETVLMRILRGSGLAGLRGVRALREDGVVRPLIDCSRTEVLAYAAAHGVPYRDDPSNADPRFERVRIRGGVLADLRAEDPRVAVHLAQLAEEADELDGWLRQIATERLAALDQSDRLPLGVLDATPAPARRAVLAAWIERVTGRASKRAHITALLHHAPEVLLGGGWLAILENRAYVAREALDHPTRSRPSKSSPDRRSDNRCQGGGTGSTPEGGTGPSSK